MHDYYAHDLGVALDRPLVIASLPGGRGEDVAYAIASLTGLPVSHIDEQIMHRVGTGLTRSVLTNGYEKVEERKRHCISNALGRVPYAVIALGDISLLSEATWNELHNHADVVGIHWSDLELLPTLKSPTPRMHRQYWQLYRQTIEHLIDITTHFGRQKAYLRACEHQVEGRGRGALAIAQEVIKQLALDPV